MISPIPVESGPSFGVPTPRRQILLGQLQPLEHLRPRCRHIRIVGKRHIHRRQPIPRRRAQILHLRQPGHLHLDRYRHQPLHLERPQPVRLGQDHHLLGRDVRDRVDRQVLQVPSSAGDHRQRQDHHQPATADQPLEETFHQPPPSMDCCSSAFS